MQVTDLKQQIEALKAMNSQLKEKPNESRTAKSINYSEQPKRKVKC